jgi:hypothetical protein
MTNLGQKLGTATAALAIGLLLLLIVGPTVWIAVACYFRSACP